jgi:phospholipase C
MDVSHATDYQEGFMLPGVSQKTFESITCSVISTAVTALVIAAMPCEPAAADDVKTTTPIKHLIVLIGENHTFDNIYGTYKPRSGHSIANLLSRRIVHEDGTPGPNFYRSMQFQMNQPYPSLYFIDALKTQGKTIYQQAPLTPSFPPPNTAYVPTAPGGLDQGQGPFGPSVPDSLLPRIEPNIEAEDLGLLRTGASGLPMFSTDTRVANATDLPNGLFQVSGPAIPYDSYTGDSAPRRREEEVAM